MNKSHAKNLRIFFMNALLFIAFLFIPYSTVLAHGATSAGIPFSLAPMLKTVLPAVVRINVQKISLIRSFQTEKPRRQKNDSVTVGSGVIIDAEKGLIVTNAHVIAHSNMLIVTLNNGRRYRANLIGEDDGFDIAIIQIHASHLTSLSLGDSDQLQVGDLVAAIGTPFGLNQTVTSGVVSALNRSEPKIEGFQSFIQTDTPINPGNSGGALVNMKGELIGINTAIYTPMLGNIGIGFAIPSDMVKSVVDQLIRYGKVSRGVLGVIGQDITPPLADAMNLTGKMGVLVTKVIPNSPADIAGVEVADIIEKLNGKEVRTAQQLRNTLGVTRPGTPIELTISRQGKEFNIKAQVGNAKVLAQQNVGPFLAGLRLQNFHELEADGTFLDGIVVTGVSEASAAALAGILPGDVITQANNENIQSIEQLEKITTKKPNQLLLAITRGEESLFLVIEPQNG